MTKAGTNAGMVQERTRLVIQAGILAPSLGKGHTSHAFLHLESRKQCPHLGQPSPLYRVWAILNAEVSRRLFREIWRPKARKYVPPHVNIFFGRDVSSRRFGRDLGFTFRWLTSHSERWLSCTRMGSILAMQFI